MLLIRIDLSLHTSNKIGEQKRVRMKVRDARNQGAKDIVAAKRFWLLVCVSAIRADRKIAILTAFSLPH